MAEAIRVLAGDLGLVGTNEVVPHEGCQQGSHLCPLWGECLDGTVMEELALDRAQLQQHPLRLFELVEARGEQGPQGRRDIDLGAVAGKRDHLGKEEGVTAGSPNDALPHVGRDGLAHKRFGRLLR